MSIEQIGTDRFFLDVRFYKGGKQFRHRETFAGCRKNADRRYWTLMEDLQAKAQNGLSSFSYTTTFEHIIEYYLEHSNVDLRSLHYLKTLMSDLGNIEISEMRAHFDRYLLLLKKTKSKNTGRLLTNNTINRYIGWAKAAFNCAVRAGMAEKNPLQYFQKLPTRPRDRMLTEDEKEKLLKVVKTASPHIYPIVLFSMLVPCRCGELLALKRSDYNMISNTIHIPAEITKMKRPCIKPVPDCCKEYFRSIPVESPYLFFRREGGKYCSLGNFRKSFKRCLKLAGIENYRFHDQRRGAYTDLLLKGNAPHIVMQVSGHATDMSKVYFGRNEMNAAKSIDFKEGTLRGTLEVGGAMQTAVK